MGGHTLNSVHDIQRDGTALFAGWHAVSLPGRAAMKTNVHSGALAPVLVNRLGMALVNILPLASAIFHTNSNHVQKRVRDD